MSVTSMYLDDRNSSASTENPVENLRAPAGLLSIYQIMAIVIAVITVLGNGIIIIVFFKNKSLRKKTNYYIASLAIIDACVGILGVPVAVSASMNILDRSLLACLFSLCSYVCLCSISILHLIAISIDRYWAILRPISYSQNIDKKTSFLAIAICWILGLLIGIIPLFGWNASGPNNTSCIMVKILDKNYLRIFITSVLVVPSILLASIYIHIYCIISKRLKKIITVDGLNKLKINEENKDSVTIRVTNLNQKQETRIAKSLSVIVIFFIFCWIPTAVVGILSTFHPDYYDKLPSYYVSIILTHLNSALNPILYAYHLKGFKNAFRKLFQNIITTVNNSRGIEGNNTNDT